MKKLALIISFWSIFVLLAVPAARADGPVQVAIFNPLQLIDEDQSVHGFRFDFLYGDNYSVSGLDMGIMNRTEDEQRGVQFGIYNSSFDVVGLQLGIVNRADFLEGVQIGLVNIHTEGRLKFLPLVNFAF